MSIWSTDELEQQIAAWKKALLSVSRGKAYSIAGRTLTLQDVAEIRATIEWLDAERRKLIGQSGPVFVTGRVVR